MCMWPSSIVFTAFTTFFCSIMVWVCVCGMFTLVWSSSLSVVLCWMNDNSSLHRIGRLYIQIEWHPPPSNADTIRRFRCGVMHYIDAMHNTFFNYFLVVKKRDVEAISHQANDIFLCYGNPISFGCWFVKSMIANR